MHPQSSIIRIDRLADYTLFSLDCGHTYRAHGPEAYYGAVVGQRTTCVHQAHETHAIATLEVEYLALLRRYHYRHPAVVAAGQRLLAAKLAAGVR